MAENRDQSQEVKIAFESLKILINKWYDGSIEETIDDWKWIFSYSKKYKWAIVYSTVMGLVSSTLGVVSSLMSKYLLDVITGYQTDKLCGCPKRRRHCGRETRKSLTRPLTTASPMWIPSPGPSSGNLG